MTNNIANLLLDPVVADLRCTIGEHRQVALEARLGEPRADHVVSRELRSLVEAGVREGRPRGEVLREPGAPRDAQEPTGRPGLCTERVQVFRVEPHELVIGLLARGGGDVVGRELGQLIRAPRPSITEPHGDGEETRAPGALA